MDGTHYLVWLQVSGLAVEEAEKAMDQELSQLIAQLQDEATVYGNITTRV